MRIPTYTSAVVPVAFQAVIKQRSITVWQCKHKHPTQDDARACAIAETEVMKCQAYLACPKCKDDVDFTIEHLNISTGDWICQPRITTPAKRKKVRT